VQLTSELFSAMRHQFKHLEFYYFHNCVYERVWRDARRMNQDKLTTLELLHKYNKDYKVIFVGDAAMSPYELTFEGGSVEHHNDEAGVVWLNRIRQHFPAMAWINPIPEQGWAYYKSITMIRQLMDGRMYPLTVTGLVNATRDLMKTGRNKALPVLPN
jgi:hypothetical protein